MANRVFGHIFGNPVGNTYVNREAAADARVHRPNQGGIWGGKDGAESIVVSGGYVDDQDYGESSSTQDKVQKGVPALAGAIDAPSFSGPWPESDSRWLSVGWSPYPRHRQKSRRRCWLSRPLRVSMPTVAC